MLCSSRYILLSRKCRINIYVLDHCSGKIIISKEGFAVHAGEDMQLAFAIELCRGLDTLESI